MKFLNLLALFFSYGAYAESISFDVLWKKIKTESPSLSKEEHLLKASELAASRAQLHWLPSLGLGASVFSTNDPASNLFSNLSQRKITAIDFVPTTLNDPGRNTFQTLTLGLDLPLYEGGRKVAESNAFQKMSEASEFKRNSVLLSEYVESAISYSRLSTFTAAGLRLKVLSERVAHILSRYSIGSESNPVGYSGMLGLKSLKNRIDGEILAVETKQNADRQALTEKAKLDQKIIIKSEDTLSFLNRALPLNSENASSFIERAALSEQEAMAEMKSAEKSRFLPRIGAFANQGFTRGQRDTGSNLTGGLYLQWSLFTPENFNRVSERHEQKMAAEAGAQSIIEQSDIGRQSLDSAEDLLKKSIVLLLDSEKLLDEQVKVASRLFQSGSISALQLSEVLNRRVDLILSMIAVEQGLIETRGKRIMLTSASGVVL